MYAYAEDRLPPPIVFTLWSFVEETTLAIHSRKAFKYGTFNLRRSLERFYLPETQERINQIMPRAKLKGKDDVQPLQKATITWTNVPLTPNDSFHIEEQFPDEATVVSAMVDLLGQGWSVSVKPDDRKNGFVCFITGDYNSGLGAGMGFAGRSSNPFDAIRSALYKVAVVVSGQYAPAPRDEGSRFG